LQGGCSKQHRRNTQSMSECDHEMFSPGTIERYTTQASVRRVRDADVETPRSRADWHPVGAHG
jgi:hypothetical protein